MFKKKPITESRRPSTGAQAKIYSRDNVARYSERARQRRRGHTVRRVALIAVLGVLLSATTAAGLWFATIMGKLGDSNVITDNLRQILVDTDEAKDPFYVLLLGTDGRPGEDTYRADSIILARIDPTQKQATLISIPRDTKVVYNGSTMKINACHTYGGAEAMVQAVNELCGVQISHYAEVSFDGMQSLIDSVGGIDINATDDVDDPSISTLRSPPVSSTWMARPPLPMPVAATSMPMATTHACATSVRCSAPSPTRSSTTSMPPRSSTSSIRCPTCS